jgi:tripartite-type tricarboxylate transporter receptor subunit TctC
MIFKKTLLAAAAIAVVLGLTVGSGQAFPGKDITLVVPWGAGGGTDVFARILVKNAKKHLGVNVNVVNRTGGMGAIGMASVATARPDGYTVGMVTFQLSAYRNQGLDKLSYRDFGLIGLVNQSAGAISVRTDSQFKNFTELVEYAKANPNVLTAGHSGAGGGWHLSLASAALAADAKFNYVPFDGAAPTRTALLGGHIAIATSGIDEMLEFYKDKRVRILAVNDLQRHPMFPDVPTLAEAGYAIEQPVLDWRGLAAPKGTPADRMKVLIEGFKKCFDDPEFQAAAKEKGFILTWKGPEDFEKFLIGMEKTLEGALKATGLYNPVK